MKTTILIVLTIVTITTPCLALEIEPEGLFGIHGTVWRKIGVEKSHVGESEETFGIDRGFYDRRVYGLKRDQFCSHNKDYYYYYGLLAVIFYRYDSTTGFNSPFIDEYTIVEEGILFPLIGIGFVKVSEYYCEYYPYPSDDSVWEWYDPYYVLLIKVNNWWNPSRDYSNFE